ncbi:PAS domain-containing protein [Methylobacterium sp. JK268]
MKDNDPNSTEEPVPAAPAPRSCAPRPSPVIRRSGLDGRGTVFFAAVEMTQMPMILTDPHLPDNPIVFANRAFQDLTGYAEGELLGRNCRLLQGVETSQDTVAELRDALRARQAITAEILNYKRDGTPFWNSVFIGPVYDEAGDLIYFFASQLDVSRRWASEHALRQAQKMDAIGQLTTGLAHDFNNLLQVVTGNLEMALQGITEERPRRQIERALEAAERGTSLTRQLLSFARRTRLEPRALDLNAQVRTFSEVVATTLGEGIALSLDLAPDLPAVVLDRTQLEVALLNVLLNARDAMPEGGTITVATGSLRIADDVLARGLPPGDYAVLRVRDEGEGMPGHVLARATEPFFSTKGAARGTGLGLAVVHGFAQQSLGRLEIDSRVGAGTTVSLVFPAAAGVTPEKPDNVPAPPRGAILVVEAADAGPATSLGDLEGLGYRVLLARDGAEALAVIAADPDVALLFADLARPGALDGLALAREAHRLRPGLPVLLADADARDLAAAEPPVPGLELLGKPYRKTDLAARVRSALDRGAAPRGGPGPWR